MRSKRIGLLAVLVVVGAGTALHAQNKTPPVPPSPEPAVVSAHVMLTPKDIQWVDAPPSLPAGAKFAVIEGDPKVAGALVTFRLKVPNGWSIPAHFHPADEHVTVIKGSFNMGMGDKLDKKAVKPFPAGSFMIMPKGERHFAVAKGETIVQVHAIGPWGITYVNPDDDPRNKKPDPAKK